MNAIPSDLVITHLWQITILFLLVWIGAQLASRLAGQHYSHFIFMLWIAFFIKCLIPPIIESPLGLMAWLTPSAQLTAVIDGPLINATRGSLSDWQAPDLSEATQTGFTSNQQITMWFLSVWAIGSAALGIYYLTHYLRVATQIQRESKLAQESDDLTTIRDVLDLQMSHLGLTARSIEVIPTERYSIPFAFGLFRGSIVLPTSIAESPELLRSVLAHELCHLWRRDHWIGWLQMLTQILFWFHPAVWLASRSLDRWCEVCCDDDTMRVFSIKPTQYAKGLVEVLSLQSEPRPINWAPGLRPAEITKRRIQTILGRSRSGFFRRTYHFAAIVILLLVVPATGSVDRKFGLVLTPAETQSFPPPRVGPGARLNFIIGHWDLYESETDATPTGHSEFHYEKSGRMIREDWTGRNGMTAQGISFFDPSNQTWRMTWVDSAGTIMESNGKWVGNTLHLEGVAKDRQGQTTPIRVRLTQKNEDMLTTEFAVLDDKQATIVSSSVYRRAQN